MRKICRECERTLGLEGVCDNYDCPMFGVADYVDLGEGDEYLLSTGEEIQNPDDLSQERAGMSLDTYRNLPSTMLWMTFNNDYKKWTETPQGRFALYLASRRAAPVA